MLREKTEELRRLAMMMIPNIDVNAKNHWNRNQRHARTKRDTASELIGTLSKSLFGTPTTEDLNNIASRINSVIGQQRNIAYNLQLHDEILQSYMKINDGRMDSHRRMMEFNSRAVIDLEQNMKQTFDYFQKLHQRMRQQISFATKVCLDVASTIDYLNSLRKDLKDLIRGQLMFEIIPPEVLSNFFRNATIKARSLGLQFVDTNPLTYYRKSSYVLTMHNNSIWITMKFAMGRPLNFYEVLVWPMPVGNKFNHGTIVEDLPKYVAIKDGFYMTFDASEIERCDKDENMLKCEKQRPLLSTMRARSCTVAIIEGNQHDIKYYCKTTLKKNAIEPTIRTISADKILVQDVWKMKVKCDNESEKTMDGCKTCLMNVPCDCVITTRSISFRTTTTDRCQRRTRITHLFQKNVAIFNHFFEETSRKLRPMEWFEEENHPELELNINTTQLEEQLHNFLTFKSEVGLEEVRKKLEEASKRAKELASLGRFAAMYGKSMALTLLGISTAFTVILNIVVIIALWCLFPRLRRRFMATELKRRERKKINQTKDTFEISTYV